MITFGSNIILVGEDEKDMYRTLPIDQINNASNILHLDLEGDVVSVFKAKRGMSAIGHIAPPRTFMDDIRDYNSKINEFLRGTDFSAHYESHEMDHNSRTSKGFSGLSIVKNNEQVARIRVDGPNEKARSEKMTCAIFLAGIKFFAEKGGQENMDV